MSTTSNVVGDRPHPVVRSTKESKDVCAQAAPTRGHRRYGGFLVVALAALSLMGCQSAVQVEQQQGTGASPVAGGVLHIVQAADVQPATLFSQNNPNFSVTRTVFNSLVDYDHKTLEPQPELATEWSFSPDGKTLTFTLRSGVTFHDGRPFTAQDVVASIKAVQRPDVASQTKAVATHITAMQTPSDLQVVLTFDQALSNTMDLFLMMPVIDGQHVDDLLAGKNFNGTGPFAVQKYSPGQGFTLTKNTRYWKPGQPFLDGVDITVVRDSQSMLSALRAGQSDLALDLAPLDASTLEGQSGYQVVRSDASDSVQYIGSNVTVPLLKDKRVRQAISYAIDRERVLKQVDGGIGQVTSLPWASSSPAFDAGKNQTYALDLDKSKQLLAAAGATGKPVNVYYDSGFQPNNGIATIVEFDLAQAGLQPKLVPLQASDFLDKLRAGGFDGMFLTGHGFGQLNPATLVTGAFPYNASKNASSFDDQQYKDLAQEVFVSNGKPSAETLGSLNDYLLDQQFVSDLVLTNHTFTTASKVHGLSYTMLDYLDLDATYLG